MEWNRALRATSAISLMGAASSGAASLACIAALVVTAGGAMADPLISLNAPVTVTATDSQPGAGFNNGTGVNLQNITNGVILPDATNYGSSTATSQAIEWNGSGYVFQISLSGSYNVSGILVNADDNDVYYVDYLDPSTHQWDALYTAPIVSQGYGLRVRPTPNSTDPYVFATPVVTNAVEIFGGASNDNFTFGAETGAGGYAVAQVELFGTPAGAPEPATWAMLLGGLGMVGFAMRRRASVNVTYA